MKQFNVIKKLFFAALICAAGSVSGQIHPLAFGPTALSVDSNWYKDYVGLRFEVTSPASISGSKIFTLAADGTAPWGTAVVTPIVNVPIFMDTTSDSFGCSSFTGAAAASMVGKIAVIWRGPISGPCDFGCKAHNAYVAGAVAIVIINEYAGQGPIGMAASTTCASPPIPIFMIGNLDGVAISGQYRAGVPVTMSITPWSLGARNDIGLVDNGGAVWHNFAIPANQLTTNAAHKALDGAFVGNFGSSTAMNMKLTDTLSFTPTGGSATVQHTGSVTLPGAFTTLDSIEAMFDTTAGAEYNLSATGNGRFDLKYTVSSDTLDQYLGDNAQTYSFYTTDSLYSKGRYDFTNNAPIFGSFESFGAAPTPEFIWGPLYFVGGQAGTAVQKIQFSLFQNSASTTPVTVFLAGTSNVYIYEWVDASGDGIVQNDELTLVSSSTYTFNGTTDTSGALLELDRNAAANFIGDPTGATAATVFLDPNSWYYVAVDVPSATFLGVDGIQDPFPRIYGRFHANATLDYSNIQLTGGGPTAATATTANYEVAASAPVALIGSIDSFTYSAQKGLIPQVAMIVNNHPDTINHVGVQNVSKPFGEIAIYPNPATDYLNVSVNLDQVAKTISYEIIDGAGRFVSKETHNNVQSETFEISTSCLAPGNYYLAINANGQLRVNKFTIVK